MLDDILSNPLAYLPPRSSLWLWIGGPILMALIYALSMHTGNAARRKRMREAEIWRGSLGAGRADEGQAGHPYRPEGDKKKKKGAPAKDAGPPRVASIPSALRSALLAVGGGDPVAHYQLVHDLAYLSFMEANATAGSDYQTITTRLEEPGPALTVRPLPIIDSARAINTGVQFKKDPELMEKFLVEGPDAKAIGKWLSNPMRRALCEMPWVWLRVEGMVMTVTAFGTLQADKLDQLVELADALFAEHGADGGPSLFGEDEPEPAKKAGGGGKLQPVPASATTLAETPRSKKKS